ncbi:MAG: reverse transcriptase domain-containing protein [Candidatus Cybelea sp.]
MVSPLLANVYLHYAFDLWAHRWRRHANGSVIIVRYADDIVVGIQRYHDAQAFLPQLRERMAKFSLTLHAEKTRLIEFGRFARMERVRRGRGKPETFSFLGFTHICTEDENGKFLLLRRTRRDRMRLTLQAIKDQLRRRMHRSIPEQGRWLQRVLRGYFAYHAVPGNIERLKAFRKRVALLWFKTLRRRGQKDRTTWRKLHWLKRQWLPAAKALHPWPDQRFDVEYSKQEPSAGNLHARICAGGAQYCASLPRSACRSTLPSTPQSPVYGERLATQKALHRTTQRGTF